MAGTTHHVHRWQAVEAMAQPRSQQEIGEDIMEAFITNHRCDGHVPYSEGLLKLCRSLGVKMVLMIRDPRDIITSHYYHVKAHYESGQNFEVEGVPLSERKDPMMDLIKTIVPRCWEIMKWKYAKDYPVLTMSYEQMLSRPVDASRQMRNFAPDVFRYEPLSLMVNRVSPASSPTYRKGIVGDWKNNFKVRHVKAFCKLEGIEDLMRAMGYSLEESCKQSS